MPNPERYFVEERKNGTYAVKGQGNERATRVFGHEGRAESSAHHFAGRHGVVDFKGTNGRFESECTCSRCKANR